MQPKNILNLPGLENLTSKTIKRIIMIAAETGYGAKKIKIYEEASKSTFLILKYYIFINKDRKWYQTKQRKSVAL